MVGHGLKLLRDALPAENPCTLIRKCICSILSICAIAELKRMPIKNYFNRYLGKIFHNRNEKALMNIREHVVYIICRLNKLMKTKLLEYVPTYCYKHFYRYTRYNRYVANCDM